MTISAKTISLVFDAPIFKRAILNLDYFYYTFHKKSTAQSKRDELKNKVFEKYEILLIRLSAIEAMKRI